MSQSLMGKGLASDFLVLSNFKNYQYPTVYHAHTKKAHSNEWAFLLIGSLAVFYSHMGKPHTTIDANVFHF